MKATIFRIRSVVLGFAVLFACGIFATSQTVVDDSLWITPRALTEAGIRVPSQMTSINDVLGLPARWPTHQELTLQWDSLPGSSSKVVREEEIIGQPIRGDFKIVERRQHVKGAYGSPRPPMFLQDELVAVAVSSGNEVRALLILVDPRKSYSEDVQHRQRWNFIKPSVSFGLWLPDDPDIRSVVFFIPVRGDDGKPRLQRIGDLALPPAQVSPPRLRPE